jgi:hypothetical protein
MRMRDLEETSRSESQSKDFHCCRPGNRAFLASVLLVQVNKPVHGSSLLDI